VVEAEAELERAERQRAATARDQRRRIVWLAASTASYAVDALFLALFFTAGTIPGHLPVAYAAGAAAICAAQYAAYASGWNLKRSDPNLTSPTVGLAVLMQLGVVLVAPQITFPYLTNLFTVFAFGMIWLSLRESVVVWLLGTAGTGMVLYAVGDRISIPSSTPYELALVWLYFSLVLGRCLILSVVANDLRARLAGSRHRLAATLKQVQQLASHDELTQVLNRRALIAALERELSRSERVGGTFAVALLDIDHFKAVNDSHGHAAGDEVLKTFVTTVRDLMRKVDVFGRYGGEEFLVLMIGAPPADARQAIDRIRAAVEACDLGATAAGLAITVSAGVASFRQGDTVARMLQRADAALYEAKRAGRNRVVAVA